MIRLGVNGLRRAAGSPSLDRAATESPMSAEWIAVVVAIVAAGVTATVAVTSGFRRLADSIAAMDRRVARLEGMVETLQTVMLADRRPRTGSDEGAVA